MRRHGLRDDQWDRVKDLLPGQPGSVGVTAADNRGFVEAVLYRYRAPASRGKTCRNASVMPGTSIAASAAGRNPAPGKGVFQHLAVDADNEYAMIDSTIVRAHQHSAGAQKSR
jgi:transposase